MRLVSGLFFGSAANAACQSIEDGFPLLVSQALSTLSSASSRNTATGQTLTEMAVMRARLVEARTMLHAASPHRRAVDDALGQLNAWAKLAVMQYGVYLAGCLKYVGLGITSHSANPASLVDYYLSWSAEMTARALSDTADELTKLRSIGMLEAMRLGANESIQSTAVMQARVILLHDICERAQLEVLKIIKYTKVSLPPSLEAPSDVLERVQTLREILYSPKLNAKFIVDLSSVINDPRASKVLRREAVALRDSMTDSRDLAAVAQHVWSLENIDRKIAFAHRILLEGKVLEEVDAVLGSVAVWEAHIARAGVELSSGAIDAAAIAHLERNFSAVSKHAFSHFKKLREQLLLPQIRPQCSPSELRDFLRSSVGSDVVRRLSTKYGSDSVGHLVASMSAHNALFEYQSRIDEYDDGSIALISDRLQRIGIVQHWVTSRHERMIEFSREVSPVLNMDFLRVPTEPKVTVSVLPASEPAARLKQIIEQIRFMVTPNLAKRWVDELAGISANQGLTEELRSQAVALSEVLSNPRAVKVLTNGAWSLHNVELKLATIAAWMAEATGYTLEVEGFLASLSVWYGHLIRVIATGREEMLGVNDDHICRRFDAMLEDSVGFYHAQREALNKKDKAVLVIDGELAGLMPTEWEAVDTSVGSTRVFKDVYGELPESRAIAVRSMIAEYCTMWKHEVVPHEVDIAIDQWTLRSRSIQGGISLESVKSTEALFAEPILVESLIARKRKNSH